MKPIAILTTDANPDYLFCLPIVAKSWNLQGFAVKSMIIAPNTPPIRDFIHGYLDDTLFAWTPPANIKSTLNPALYVQCLRLYVTQNSKVGQYTILGDVDMFIASNFLYRDFDKVNVFGHDLTGFNEIPICYVGATAERWEHIMKRADMLADLEKYSKYKSEVWHEAWGADQQILTARLKEYGHDKINFINRGIDPNNQNLPLGRWDRYGGFKKPGKIVHDVHLPRKPYSDEVFPLIVDMCKSVYPKEDWTWLESYRRNFVKQFVV